MLSLRLLSALVAVFFYTGCETTVSSSGRSPYRAQPNEIRRGVSEAERRNWNDISPEVRQECIGGFLAYRGQTSGVANTLIEMIDQLEMLSSAEAMERQRLYQSALRHCEQSRKEYLETVSKKVRPVAYQEEYQKAVSQSVWSFMPPIAISKYNAARNKHIARLDEAMRHQNEAAQVLAKCGMRTVRVYRTAQGLFEIDLIKDNLRLLAEWAS